MQKKDYTLFILISSALSITLLILSIIFYWGTIFFSISLITCINLAIQYYIYSLSNKDIKKIRLSKKEHIIINTCFIIPLILSCTLIPLMKLDAYSTKAVMIVVLSFMTGTATAVIYSIKLFKRTN